MLEPKSEWFSSLENKMGNKANLKGSKRDISDLLDDSIKLALQVAVRLRF
jgi:hypothetical protein